MKWFHKCDFKWLCARQNYLTATDVKDLLPVTKTGRKRTVSEESYYKVLSRKMSYLNEPDCESTGAAARGHILEPYAIEAYNSLYALRLYHIDDIVITRPNAQVQSLAFSPDSANVPVTRDDGHLVSEPMLEIIGEVKSYGAEKHMVCGYSNKEDLEERWQIATAMAVQESIQLGRLLFYNPAMTEKLFIFSYSRKELSDEIDIILGIEKDWLKFTDDFMKQFSVKYISNAGQFATLMTEKEIVAKIVKSESLNPNAIRSVVL